MDLLGDLKDSLEHYAALPQCVLEIPAIILSAAHGLWLGVTFAKRIRRRDMERFGDGAFMGFGESMW